MLDRIRQWLKPKPPLESREFRLNVAREVSEKLVHHFPDDVHAVFVMGSTAQGRHRKDSDLDMMVIFNWKTGQPNGYYDVKNKIEADVLRRHGLPLEIRWLTNDFFERNTPRKSGQPPDALLDTFFHGVVPTYSKPGYLEEFAHCVKGSNDPTGAISENQPPLGTRPAHTAAPPFFRGFCTTRLGAGTPP